MKTIHPIIFISSFSIAGFLWIVPLGAQTSGADELLQLTQTIAAQQKNIDENQAAIDKSLAVIQEDLRQAKIYVGRVGKAKGAK